VKIAVVGIGYVGLSLSVLLAQKYQVVALDIIKEKVDLHFKAYIFIRTCGS
jgi:UDPglucose 6-dehydrogenase